MTWHLAQYNVARAIASPDDALMADFYSQVAEVNAVAESSPGFVWRLKGADASVPAQQPGDPFVLLNLSVWVSVEALKAFTYGAGHLKVFRERHRWFDKPSGPNQVLWWIPAGHEPTFAEGAKRMELLRKQGPSPEAFTFAQPFSMPEEK